ncbi:hypothetical protein HHI36_000787 [Cryptolaemus montrouzieri]|uniref:ZP domain-containing protein n=1 Tax=Cryptolaemus montrouzieri TaxID=559131 RepID=A0ABD2P5X0_9CUCU
MIQFRVGPIWLLKATFLSSVFASQQSRLPIVKNEIKSLDVTCDAEFFNATVTLEHPFKGMFSAKEFSQECNAFGTYKNTVSLSLPTSGCGLRLTSKRTKNGKVLMQYTVTLAIQQDRHLRQIADQEIYVSCQINSNVFSLKSASIMNEIEGNIIDEGNLRNGRMRQDGLWNTETDKKVLKNAKLQEILKSAKAWMEIIPQEVDSNDNQLRDKLQVGELAKLIVKSTLPVGIGWKVVDCAAHDGLGDSSQKLLDEIGCPVDDQIMPKPVYGPVENLDFIRYQEASSIFPAFKFPDRDRLHLTCVLVLCKGPCMQDGCNKNISFSDDYREGKTITAEYEKDNILDQINIFNSVEVLATSMNEYYKTEEYQETRDSSFTFKGLPGDETLCISYHKIAIAFCILGMLFLIAALIATGGLLKARRTGNALSVYTRSIFSSTSATDSSQYGSKLLHDHSSFGFSSTGGLQYGRIL